MYKLTSRVILSHVQSPAPGSVENPQALHDVQCQEQLDPALVDLDALREKMVTQTTANACYAVSKSQISALDTWLNVLYRHKTLELVPDQPCAIERSTLHDHFANAGGGTISTNTLVNVLKKIGWAMLDVTHVTNDTQPLIPGRQKDLEDEVAKKSKKGKKATSFFKIAMQSVRETSQDQFKRRYLLRIREAASVPKSQQVAPKAKKETCQTGERTHRDEPGIVYETATEVTVSWPISFLKYKKLKLESILNAQRTSIKISAEQVCFFVSSSNANTASLAKKKITIARKRQKQKKQEEENAEEREKEKIKEREQ